MQHPCSAPSPRRPARRLGLLLAAVLALATVPVFAAAAAPPAAGLDNGLAVTPQMGFNDWNAYGCNVSATLIESTALAMHTDGMQAAGYQYVNIDDCWMGHSRNTAGQLVPDPAKFPSGANGKSGIAVVADYVHSLGLKLGIYEDAGTKTCGGYPGSLGHESTDADSFASWGVDYLKYDDCYSNGSSPQGRYTAMRDALAVTGRPILFSICTASPYADQSSVWTWGANIGNSWRTDYDIKPTFSSMLASFHQNLALASYARPNGWNDPDMLEIGNGMSATEDRSEFSLWAEMAAPLLSGTNIASATSTTLSILTTKNIIAIDQDPLGRQGVQVASNSGLDVLAKPLANGDVAVVLFNETAATATISTSAAAVGKTGASRYTLTDQWTGATSTTPGTISASVPAHATVLYRLSGGSATTVHPAGEVHAIGADGSVRGSDMCLDVNDFTTTPETQLWIWVCNGDTNQIWTHTASNQLTVYSGNSKMCLDAYKKQTTPGTKVEIYGCNGGANQQWILNANGTITGAQSSLCLGVVNAGTSNRSLVELQTCDPSSTSQQWTL